MTRRTAALVLLALVPTVALAAGWLHASTRARDLAIREVQAGMMHSASVARAAAEESLEELRTREDARPFFVYNHYYSPPDVIALNDPVAVSPLAAEPDDPRVVGYFQIGPGGDVRTPYSALGTEQPMGERERRVRQTVEQRALATRWTDDDGVSGLLAVATPEAAVEGPELAAATRPRARPRVRRRTPSEAAAQPIASAADDNAGAPQGPLTVNLEAWGNAVAEDIQLAQQGSVLAQQRVITRGRAAPITNRLDVERPPGSDVGLAIRAPSDVGSDDRQDAAAGELPRTRVRRTAPRAPEVAQATPPPLPMPVVQQEQADIVYGAMTFERVGESLVLRREVTHAGVSVVQGILLDAQHLRTEWLPALIERRTQSDGDARIVADDADARCAVREPLSELLGVAYCVPPEVVSARVVPFERSVQLQRAALVGLALLVLLAVVAIVRASARTAALARQQGAFVSAVSHELRTPLTTLRMHAEMLQEGLVSDERKPQVHDEMVAHAVRLGRLVENVLEFSRIEAGALALRLESGDLAACVGRVASAQRTLLASRGLELDLKLPESASARFDADAVERILVNLLDNAAKYAEGSEPPVVRVTLAASDEGWLLSVHDNGPGIPAAMRERVFERFVRVEREETAHAPGTGLGLALVRELARAHRGEASIAGEPGTTVSVLLPDS